MTLREIVSAYIREHRESARSEMRCFEIEPNLRAAIRKAALCLRRNQKHPEQQWNKRHPHQWRLSKAVLDESERLLQRRMKELQLVSDFAALHHIVEREIGTIHGIGALTVYDVAHRIGAFLGKSPELVYLHRGTKIGAAALGLSGKAIRPNELPLPFSRLTAAECEDCLCIYKGQLRDGIRTTPLQLQSRSPDPCRVKLICRSGVVSSRCGG